MINKSDVVDPIITEELVREFDKIIVDLMVKYRLSALQLSSIINARLMWANYLSGSESSFKDALNKFSKLGIEHKEERIMH